MKKQSSVALLLAAAALLFAGSCSETDTIIDPDFDIIHGNGNVVEESRVVGSCNSVNHGGIGHLYIDPGSRETLRVRAEENLLEHLHTEVQAGQLVIWKDWVTLLNTYPIEYYLRAANLERAELTGAGHIHGTDLHTGPLVLRMTGVGAMEFVNLNAPSIDVVSSGLGGVSISGSVQEQTINMRGLGSYDGSALTSAVADVRIANGGSATVRVQDHLTVTINGSGNVYYYGDPTVDSTINGSGQVIQLGG